MKWQAATAGSWALNLVLAKGQDATMSIKKKKRELEKFPKVKHLQQCAARKNA